MAEWIITVHQPYVRMLVNGEKTMELRTRVPKSLHLGDTIYIVEAGSSGSIAGGFIVKRIMRYGVYFLCSVLAGDHKVPAEKIFSYAGGRKRLVGISLVKLNSEIFPTNISDFGLKRAPQWFTKIK